MATCVASVQRTRKNNATRFDAYLGHKMISQTDLSIILWNALKEAGATFTPAKYAPCVYCDEMSEGQPLLVHQPNLGGDDFLAPYFGAGGASNLLMAFEKLQKYGMGLNDEQLLLSLCAALKINRETGELR